MPITDIDWNWLKRKKKQNPKWSMQKLKSEYKKRKK